MISHGYSPPLPCLPVSTLTGNWITLHPLVQTLPRSPAAPRMEMSVPNTAIKAASSSDHCVLSASFCSLSTLAFLPSLSDEEEADKLIWVGDWRGKVICETGETNRQIGCVVTSQEKRELPKGSRVKKLKCYKVKVRWDWASTKPRMTNKNKLLGKTFSGRECWGVRHKLKVREGIKEGRKRLEGEIQREKCVSDVC